MEVQGRQPNDPTPSYRRFLEARKELFQSNREHLRAGREERLSEARKAGEALENERVEADVTRPAETSRAGDTLEVSSFEELSPAANPERLARVAELRRLYDTGELNQPEFIEKAAERLLESSDY